MSMFLTKDLSEMIDDLSTMFGYHYVYDVPQKPLEKIQLETPGVPKEDFNIQIKSKTLEVNWMKNGTNFGRKYYVGKVEGVEATYKDGLLTIEVKQKKKKEDTPIEVKIKGA